MRDIKLDKLEERKKRIISNCGDSPRMSQTKRFMQSLKIHKCQSNKYKNMKEIKYSVKIGSIHREHG